VTVTDQRLRAAAEMNLPETREYVGWHELDGKVQDLSSDGVARSLDALGHGSLPEDPVDAAILLASERWCRHQFTVQEAHRRNPNLHIANLDVAVYDREYAPAAERAAARSRHLSAWPAAIDAAVNSLDQVTAPSARTTLRAARGLAAGVDDRVALSALDRLVAHLEHAAEHGDPDASIGRAALEGGYRALESLDRPGSMLPSDATGLVGVATAERERLHTILDEACERLRPGVPVAEVLAEAFAEAPTTADAVCRAATDVTAEVRRFALDSALLPDLGGEVTVGPAPLSRSWSQAMMSWAAPYEPDAPSRYYITAPDPTWPEEQQREWLAIFSPTNLPTICVHEVTPGHFTHGRAMRTLTSDVRRTLGFPGFIEGWAHHVEELYIEAGFRDGDPRYAVGVALEALLRAVRLEVSVGLHTAAMTVEDAQAMFEREAYVPGAAARGEAMRGTVDPFYGYYTLGKVTVRAVREQAKQRWGSGYDEQRFNMELLSLGAPPLGILSAAMFDPTSLNAA
jgi:uncharacterized protein (DUF885 family)